ncbi:dehydratase [Acinetobacter sp. LoGeW2-3]|uniref:MaoC family dehydratase n=1 Tax=Acinetobacter sp. LoGeW2-3 TaxID=1808001 RepID=UPI000C05C42A|nr:MaoC family dehydratase [Acinetobacter sp. LoGeW2-3]ATO20428.1 dehydratase [Acinetobacter sp. LoGeW2-3]
MLYLEDLKIGDEFKSRSYRMTEAEILQFAEKFDPQTFHTDAQQAQKHPIFKGLAASGWHTAAVVMRLWSECFPIAYGLVGTDSHVRWPCPTRPDDEIRVIVTITDIKPSQRKPDRGIVRYETQALNQKDQVLFNSTTNILVFKQEFTAV